MLLNRLNYLSLFYFVVSLSRDHVITTGGKEFVLSRNLVITLSRQEGFSKSRAKVQKYFHIRKRARMYVKNYTIFVNFSTLEYKETLPDLFE